MTHSSPLLVLSYTRIRGNSLVLHTLSAEYGRRSFIASVSKSSPMAYFQPLSILDTEITENPRSELWRLRNIMPLYPLDSIRTNLTKNTVALFMGEVLFRTLRDGDGGQELFDWACRSVLMLDSMESDYSNYHLRFLLELAGVMGFRPSQDGLAPFAGPYLKETMALLDSDFAASMLLEFNGKARSGIASALLKYISYHIEAPVTIQSLNILSEVFR